MPAQLMRAYGSFMTNVYTSGFEPDPTDPVDVLAFVLCPLSVFAPTGDQEEVDAVAELMAPAKAEAVMRWYEAHTARARN